MLYDCGRLDGFGLIAKTSQKKAVSGLAACGICVAAEVVELDHGSLPYGDLGKTSQVTKSGGEKYMKVAVELFWKWTQKAEGSSY